MSSRDIERLSRTEDEDDPFCKVNFHPVVLAVGLRDDDSSPTIENERQNSLFRQPEQGSLLLDVEEDDLSSEPEQSFDSEQQSADAMLNTARHSSYWLFT